MYNVVVTYSNVSNDAGGMTNSVDPHQTAPQGSVFAQTRLSKYLRPLQYVTSFKMIHFVVLLLFAAN